MVSLSDVHITSGVHKGAHAGDERRDGDGNIVAAVGGSCGGEEGVRGACVRGGERGWEP